MADLIFNSKTRLLLENFINDPVQAVLLKGSPGAGKKAVAHWLAAELLGTNGQQGINNPHLLTVRPIGQSITIDSIRQLGGFLKLKSTNARQIQRAVVIEKAETMTLEAQNALLKNLEEPPAGSLFVLTSSNEHELLPTIKSRVQSIKIIPPTKNQLAEFFKLPEARFNQLYNLSGGLPGLLKSLASDTDHPLVAAINDCKKLLGTSAFERLIIMNELASKKQSAADLITGMKRLATAGLTASSEKTNAKNLANWQKILEAALVAEQALGSGVQIKLLLTDLALSI